MDGQTEMKLEGILDKFTIMMEETAWMRDIISLRRGWWVIDGWRKQKLRCKHPGNESPNERSAEAKSGGWTWWKTRGRGGICTIKCTISRCEARAGRVQNSVILPWFVGKRKINNESGGQMGTILHFICKKRTLNWMLLCCELPLNFTFRSYQV